MGDRVNENEAGELRDRAAKKLHEQLNPPDRVGTVAAHEADYKPRAWEEYTAEELGWWVRLLTKRAGHRADAAKREKDLYDAANYQAMLDAKSAGGAK